MRLNTSVLSRTAGTRLWVAAFAHNRQSRGWVGKENPNGDATEHKIHAQFETAYIAVNIKESDVKPLLSAVHPAGDEFDDYMTYLRHSNSLVERVYQSKQSASIRRRGNA